MGILKQILEREDLRPGYIRQLRIAIDIASAKRIYAAIYGEDSVIEIDVNKWLREANELKIAGKFTDLQHAEREIVAAFNAYSL